MCARLTPPCHTACMDVIRAALGLEVAEDLSSAVCWIGLKRHTFAPLICTQSCRLIGAMCAACGSAKQCADGCGVCAGVLIALNRFLQETHGSKMAFLDGSPPER